MTTAVGPIITTTQESIDTLKSLNCSAETLINSLAVLALRANLQAERVNPFERSTILDGRIKVSLPLGDVKGTFTCKDCKAKISSPGVYKIEDIESGESFTFDEFNLHKMLSHRNFNIQADDSTPEGRIDIAKACSVLKLV